MPYLVRKTGWQDRDYQAFCGRKSQKSGRD